MVLPAVLSLFLGGGVALGSPYADHVTSYTPGVGASTYYAHPEVALGEPARFSADEYYPGVVSIVNPAFLNTQIVQIGAGGSLTVQFDAPIANSPAHLYGVDAIVFGNSLFAAETYPGGDLSNPAYLFDDDAGKIEVSQDGAHFFEVPGILADRLFPTQGYLDAGAFDGTPGQMPTNFCKPVNPALTLASFNGLTFAQAVALYDGSGGGTPVDIAAAVDAQGQPAGLTKVSYVRITCIGTSPLEIDGFAAVPEPVTALLLPLALAMGWRRTRR